MPTPKPLELTERLHLVVSPQMREQIRVRASQLRISDSELVRRFIERGLKPALPSSMERIRAEPHPAEAIEPDRRRTEPREPIRRDALGA